VKFTAPVTLREVRPKEYAATTLENARLIWGDLAACARALKALALIGGAINLERVLTLSPPPPVFIAKDGVVLVEPSTGDDEIAFRFATVLADQKHGHSALAGRIGPSFDAQMALAATRQGVGDMTKQLLWARKKLDEPHVNGHLAALVAGADKWERETSAFASMVVPRLFVRGGDFGYRRGGIFLETVRQAGGMAAVDKTLARPPESTEQVLHVEKYVAGEAPAAIDARPVEDFLGSRGASRVWSTTLGELGVAIVLESHIKEDTSTAAPGWSGDVLLCFETAAKRPLVAWLTAWDTRNDAIEFEAAARKLATALPKDEGAEHVLLREAWGAALLVNVPRDLRDGFAEAVWRCRKTAAGRSLLLAQ